MMQRKVFLNSTDYVLDGTTNFAGVLDGCTSVFSKARQDKIKAINLQPAQ
jgi:hypothetical protein